MKIIKNCVILLLAVFLLSSSTLATIVIDAVQPSNLNFGDKLLVSGSVTLDQDVRGFLATNLVCDSGSKTLSTKFMDLKKGVSAEFSQLSIVPSLSGGCKVEAKLNTGNVLVDSATSSSFTITNDLKGTFESTVKSLSQLGDSLALKGSVTKQDGSVVDGIAVVNFLMDGNVVFFENTDVVSGMVSFKKDLSLIPAGSYTIDVEVNDNYGNTHKFTGVTKFEVTEKVSINASMDNVLYDPSAILNLNGNVNGIAGDNFGTISVQADFAGTKLEQKIATAKTPFSFQYKIPSTMKSGEHNILLTVKDDKGNYGVLSKTFSVKAVPTILNLNLNKSDALPNEVVVFNVQLLDQANDPIDDAVSAKLIDKEGKAVTEQTVKTNADSSFRLKDKALPGGWKIAIEGFGLKNEKPFEVLPYKAITTDIQNGTLYVTNIGNIPYDDTIELVADIITKSRKILLNLDETGEIKLKELFDPGTYDKIKIVNTNQEFDRVTIKDEGFFSGLLGLTGNAVENIKSPGKKPLLFFLFLVMLVALIFIFKPVKREGYSDFQRKKDFSDGQRKLAELQSKGIRRRTSLSDAQSYPEFGKATEADRQDFRDRMAKQVTEEEQRQSRADFSRQWSSGNYGNDQYKKPSSWNNDSSSYDSSSSGTSSNSTEDNSNSGGLINW